MNQPQNRFAGAPSLTPSIPPVPARAGESAGFVPGPAASAARPTLTVRPNGDVTLTKALLAALPHLKDRAHIDLVPPVQRGRGGTWHLDTRPTAPRRLPDPRKVARFSIPPPARYHFQTVAPIAGSRAGLLGTVGNLMRLTFALGPEVMEEVCVLDAARRKVCGQRGTGYYELLLVPETV